MKTNELTGALLDYWTARAKGNGVIRMGTRFAGIDDFNGDVFMPPLACCYVDEKQFRPSSDWQDGGPIVDQERISFYDFRYIDEEVRAMVGLEVFANDWVGEFEAEGPTHLVAAMRAFVLSRFGPEVPDDHEAEKHVTERKV